MTFLQTVLLRFNTCVDTVMPKYKANNNIIVIDHVTVYTSILERNREQVYWLDYPLIQYHIM